MNAVREHLEAALCRQIVHPVHPRVEVMWGEPHDVTGCTIRVGGFIERVPPEMVVKRVGQRNRMIEQERRDPLRNACEPDKTRHRAAFGRLFCAFTNETL